MENKKRALGRGLEQLFNGENLNLEAIEDSIYKTSNHEEIFDIDLDDLRPNPYQPRKIFDDEALEELALSIKEHGVFQPIIVKKSIKGYEIIAGERRVRASRLAGNQTIPAIIREFTDNQMMEIALLENLQRENLNAIEEAIAYKAMLEKLGLTQDELSKKVGKSRSHITNILGVLRLPKEVQKMVIQNKLTMGHARMLSKLESEEKIMELANKIINEDLTVREIESISSDEQLKRKVTLNKREVSDDYKYVEEMLRDKLDTRVKIKDKKIEICFTNTADLNRILEVLDIKE